MQLRVLGPLELVDAEGRAVALGGPKERRLLAALVVRVGQPVSEARLCDALWGDQPPPTATKTLQSYVSRLRRVLGTGPNLRIDSVETGYALRAAPEAVDVLVVEGTLAAARSAVAALEWDRAVALFREAERVWRGPVLGDLAVEPFALAEAARLEELRLAVLEERIDAELALGRHATAVPELDALTGQFPLRERLWAARMLALYRSGRQADALRSFQELRQLLEEELGIDPSPDLRALEGAVLRQDPALDWRAPVSTAAVSDEPLGALPSGLVTFLLTDVEGSTRLWDSAPAAMDVALQRHEAIIAEAVSSNRGRLLKSRGEGDSTFSVFARASEAAAAALVAQAALAAEPWPAGAEIRVRMAIHTGEAAERDQDYFGPAVNRVARLKSLAAGGEILITRATAELLADQFGAELHLVDLGERTLKDLSRPERVFALTPADVDDASRRTALSARGSGGERPRLPHALARDPLCVGRDEELAHLADLWRNAQDGLRQVVLIGGEPGIGKTTLTSAFAALVHRDGGVVLYGRCDEDLGVSFQPFAEALRALVASVGDDELRALRYHASNLARLLPEVAERLSDLAPPVPADAEAERYSLFEAVVALVASAAARGPVLLVVDDLHWAAKPTLLLLVHLLRAQVDVPLMVVGTYRDTEVARAHPFADVLASLRRERGVSRLGLTGLDPAAVQELIAATAGQDLEGEALELSDSICRRTNGNPFFVGEVLRHLAESGVLYQDDDGRWTSDLDVEDIGLPEGVRDVVGRRLSRLSPEANLALTVGAVVGPCFELRVLESIPEAGDPLRILDALDEGVAAGLLAEDRGSYSFPHALVRQTLLDELSSTRRLRLHRSIGAALESITPDEVEVLAFHFAEAAAVDPEAAARACDHALAAARRARDGSAYEQAILHLERGLEAVELTVPLDRARRCDLLLELGELQRGLLGRSAEFRRHGVQAAEDAREIGSPERLARAAMVALYPEVGAPDPVGVALVEEALAAVDGDDLTTRIALLSLLASHRTESEGRRDEGDALRKEVMRLARAVSPEVAAAAIHASWRFRAGDELDFLVDLLAAVPVGTLTAEQLTLMAQVRAAAAFDAGDLSTLDAHLVDLRRLADETHGWDPVYMTLGFSVSRALLDGRWGDADDALGRLADHAGDTPNALTVWAVNRGLLLRDQGRHDEVLALVEYAFELNPGLPAFRAGHAFILAEMGRLDEAVATLRPVAADGLASIPNDQTISVTLAMFAEAAARTGNVELASELYQALDPFRGRLASVVGIVVVGAADRYLGMLAATLGHHDEAQRHYEAAIDLEERLGARPYLVRTRTWYARMLLERGTPRDTDRARDLLSQALADADDLGMVVVASEIRALLRPPLPRALGREGPCVGREEELARLAALWDKAHDGVHQAVLLAGEPGIGKTTLAASLAAPVHSSGGFVLYGRCDEDLGVPFQPFAEALRSLLTGVSDEDLRALRHHASNLSRLLPEVSDRLPDLSPPVAADAEAERYSLFEAVVALLATVTVEAPVLLVLDDLHWAAKPTLLLLRHLVRADAAMRMLIVGTYRDTEVDRSHALAEVLADLRREASVVRFSISGLDRSAVQELVAATAGQELDGRSLELSDALHRQTSGNPFFVAEVLRHLAESGAVYRDPDGRWTSDLAADELGLPEGVRDVVGRRLSRLSAAANHVLTVGAVVGQGFDLRLLEAVADEPTAVLDALEEAVAAGLLIGDGGAYAFPHALVRQTILQELSSTRRLRLHRRIGEAMERIAPTAVEALAFHFAEAAAMDPESAAKACDHSLAAARRARSRSAHEAAVLHLERGLEAVEQTDPLDRGRRCELLLELGALQRGALGRSTDFRSKGVQAAEDARAIGSAGHLARAAVVAMYPEIGRPDPVAAALVEEALAALGDGDPALRIPLLSLLASHRSASEGEAAQGDVLRAEARRLLREVAPEVAATAIIDSWPFIDSRDGDFIVEILSGVPIERLTTQQLSLLAQVRAVAALDVGDLSTLDGLLADLNRLSDETHGWDPVYISIAFSISRALLDGRWGDADASLAQLAAHAGDSLNHLNVWSANQVLVLREQGRHEEILPILDLAVASNPGLPAFRAAQALMLAELGRLDEARAAFAPLAGPGVAAVPRGDVFHVAMATIAEVAARTGDAETCRLAYDALLPGSSRLASIVGVVVVGAVDRYLGMLAATLGDHAHAERHFQAAVELEERLASRPYLARTRAWYGRMLVERADPGDLDKAADLFDLAHRDANELGMVVLADEVDRWRAGHV